MAEVKSKKKTSLFNAFAAGFLTVIGAEVAHQVINRIHDKK